MRPHGKEPSITAVGAPIGGIAAGMVVGCANTIRWVDERAGLANIVKARQRVEKLKQKKENVDK